MRDAVLGRYALQATTDGIELVRNELSELCTPIAFATIITSVFATNAKANVNANGHICRSTRIIQRVYIKADAMSAVGTICERYAANYKWWRVTEWLRRRKVGVCWRTTSKLQRTA